MGTRIRYYQDVVSSWKKQTALPPRLQFALLRLAESLPQGKVNAKDVVEMVSDLSALPALAVTAVAPGIMTRGAMWSYHHVNPQRIISLIEHTPGLEFVMLFHGSGHVRQAALRFIDGRIASAFLLASIIYRLNDWVPEVRAEALRCLLRVLDATPPTVIAEAIADLFELRLQWQRGTSELVIVDEALSRPDVLAALQSHMMSTGTGAAVRALQALLQDSRVDSILADLSTSAISPSVRRLALVTLMHGHAKWKAGIAKQWIDKSMGNYRLAPVFKTRPVTAYLPFEALVRQGASDKATPVRKVAMQALVDRPELWSSYGDIIEQLEQDKSLAIREGMAYIRRQQALKTT